MKKLAIVSVLSLLLSMTPAMAVFPPSTSSVQFFLESGGETEVKTLSVINGWDGAFRASVVENVYNDDYLYMLTSVDFSVPSFGASEMVESKYIYAEGDTEIIKGVHWESHPFWPSTANFYVGWLTDDASDEIEFTNVGSGSALYNMQTNSNLMYLESFGFNLPTDCVPEEPELPEIPECDWCIE